MINNSSNLGIYRNQINSLETNINNTSTTLTNKINTTIVNELTPIKNRLTNVENNYLSLNGGTLNNTLHVPYLIVNPQNNDLEGGEIRLVAAANSDYSTYLNNYNDQSRILGVTRENTLNYYLTLNHSTGSITWGGNEVRFIKNTHSSGNSWYRIWSDGWIEQGGYITGLTNWTTVTITFLTAFTNANYSYNQSPIMYNGTYGGWASAITKKTTTQITSVFFASNGLYPTWYACGY